MRSKDPKKMNYKSLAKKVGYFKHNQKGLKTMTDVFLKLAEKIEAQGKIILYVWIGQGLDGLKTVFRVQHGKSVEKHYLSRGTPVYYRHKMGIFLNSVPVEVYGKLDGRIFRKYPGDGRLHAFICP